MLNACYALKGKYADKRKLADDAIYIERVLCNEAGGIQDQIAASFGGFNRIDFRDDGYTVTPLVFSTDRKKELNDRLMLFFTGFSRFSSDIAKNQVKATKDKTTELLEMKALVDDVQRLLVSKADLKEFGKLLDYTWKLKRGITSDISNNDIDLLYKKAIDAGATGGKLLGAGGGGFLLFYVEPEYQENIKKALEDLVYVPFEFENEGTRIMYFRPEYFDLESVKEGS